MKEYILVIIILILLFFLKRNTSSYDVNTFPIITCVFTLPSSGSTTFTGVKVWVAACTNTDCSKMVKNPALSDVDKQTLVSTTVVPFKVTSTSLNIASCTISLDKFKSIPTGTDMKVGIAMITKEGVIGDFAYAPIFKLIAPTVPTTTPVKPVTYYIVPAAALKVRFPKEYTKRPGIVDDLVIAQGKYPDIKNSVIGYKTAGLKQNSMEALVDMQSIEDSKHMSSDLAEAKANKYYKMIETVMNPPPTQQAFSFR